jgi:hypothetical protein
MAAVFLRSLQEQGHPEDKREQKRRFVREALHIEEHGFLLALQADLELPVARAGCVSVRRERGATLFGNEVEHIVLFVGRVAGEVDSSEKLLKESAGEHGHVQVWGLEYVTRSGNSPGLDGFEFASSVLIRGQAPKAEALRISDAIFGSG